MTVFSIMFSLTFFLVIGVFIFAFVKGISTYSKNNSAPRLTVPATVVAKRTQYHRHSTNDHMAHTSSSYYVTFEVESGDRMELRVPGTEYGLLVEGDYGSLSFQGTRYLSFQRM